ncbi:transcription-repair coupling factor [Bacillus solimangrovi]|uniref:Transcription-repair-coupling factor n=1 Tax=Bacillus solimangrovi TaxID=1305675 RepID=A0A1E5LEX6_9BACI|nr:transcription-repair coupling factor [Bacillus solimangrovi]OEH92635.1 transcription-repair coupling factor [Bacillus solimangrovi]
MRGLLKQFIDSSEIRSVSNGLLEGLQEQLITGLSGSARSVFIASLYQETGRPQLIITHNLYQAQKIYDDLVELVNENEVYLYPANDLIASEIAVASPELKGQRIEALNYWSQQSNGIVITPVAGLRRFLPNVSMWRKGQLHFEVNMEIELDDILAVLIKYGYKRNDMISVPGDFSLRGGILDIFPLTEDMPVRIELFDTEIESIRYFNVEDQRSKDTVSAISIGPASEILLDDEAYARGITNLQSGLTTSLNKIKNKQLQGLLNENITYEIEQLKQKHAFDEIYKYMSLLYETPASLIDYLPDNGLLIFDEMSRVDEMASRLENEEAEWHTALLEKGEILTDLRLSHSITEMMQSLSRPSVYLSLFLRHVPHTNPQNIVNITCKSMQDFHGQMDLLKSEVSRWKASNNAVVVLAANNQRAEKVKGVLDDYGIEATLLHDNKVLMPSMVQIVIGALNSGFELASQQLIVITEEELFKQKAKRRRRKQKMSNAERIKSYSELKVGDYVVHINHGIGKYLGIETLEINGIHKDYLNIHYSGNDKLYVPVEQIDQVQKYVGSEGKEPKVYKMGGNEWKKVKNKVQSSVQDIADDLIKLYAKREASKGYAFSPDSDMQQEFEAAFPYEETEDQLRTISEIKADMERERPMDRLLCGDVGYGKTEVALRAAFKAIANGKQVAILVPTTILAQQHYETMMDRFRNFPIEVGLLSRFRTRKQQKETLTGLKAGKVDIVVGTHRILSKDIEFHDLGLLVIDEEQRFGVTHKEKIKRMKANVDVLTLTATPIPRTLHMSMLGVRDLSVLETPPANRFPIQTYVVEYNGALVREAIERELAREGQVYFLYNHVEDIERKAQEIQMLVPDARVTFAHGQMNESELEAIILGFLEGEYDVLVSTTIIETGVDIPNVNTLIVHNADRMGLSQLYQLRGRVGRSNRIAYAYFTYKKDKILKEEAEKRLQAIKEFTELGSGFKIAMRDLTIRGAGNLLGAQQHGFIDSVGFNMYSQMLQDAIEERKGTNTENKTTDVEISIPIDAYIPEEYIPDSKQKIDMYKMFRSVDTIDEINDLKKELKDRFGQYPKEVEDLFRVAYLRVLAKKAFVESITVKNKDIIIFVVKEKSKNIDGSKLFAYTNQYRRAFRLGTDEERLKIVIDGKYGTEEERLELATELLEKLPEMKE